MDAKDMVRDSLYWSQLAEGRTQCNIGLDLGVLQKVGNFLIAWGTVSFSRMS
jgi:hypothetical protein